MGCHGHYMAWQTMGTGRGVQTVENLAGGYQLKAEVASLIPSTLVANVLATPYEVALAGFDELFRDRVVSSSAADLRAATLSLDVGVAGTPLDSWRTFRRIPDAIVGRLCEVDQLRSSRDMAT